MQTLARCRPGQVRPEAMWRAAGFSGASGYECKELQGKGASALTTSRGFANGTKSESSGLVSKFYLKNDKGSK